MAAEVTWSEYAMLDSSSDRNPRIALERGRGLFARRDHAAGALGDELRDHLSARQASRRSNPRDPCEMDGAQDHHGQADDQNDTGDCWS